MNFIKKIFEGKIDRGVHVIFQRFGKGLFENKALLEIKRMPKKVKIKSSYEFLNDFLDYLLEAKEFYNLKGVIMCTTDLRKKGYEFHEVKQFMGVKKFNVEGLNKEKIVALKKEFPDALFLISFETEKGFLKTKTKAPKSGKPNAANKEQRADFCILDTKDFSILDDFAFDISQEFKNVKINHSFQIDEIIISEEYKNDFSKARLYGIRKGKIIRHVDFDGNKTKKEIDFEA